MRTSSGVGFHSVSPDKDISVTRHILFSNKMRERFIRSLRSSETGRSWRGDDLLGRRRRILQERGMSFPKKVKSFPKGDGDGSSDFGLDDHSFAMKIAAALKSELKDRNSRAKLVAGWTVPMSARSQTGFWNDNPCGRHLVVLAQHSDQVLNAILTMAGRQESLLARKVENLRRRVFELADIVGKPIPDQGRPPDHWRTGRQAREASPAL
jgi:hypothetical protein